MPEPMNTSEEPQEKASSSQSQSGIQQWWKNTIELIRPLILTRIQIVDLAEPEQTMAGIERDTEFRGFNVWILVFSIVIASIGLNVNSTAVIIGAMLISPLMGPIMGFGLGVGVNNLSLIKKSLINLGVATGIAILSSALYFLVSPIDEAGSELLARTNPTFLDVMVAFFGGLTGILAGSRREKNNVIPGVAIATALMPPLCTAGYGLAQMNGEYFFGALYLFLINAILIATSTTLVVRYLRFPVLKPLDTEKEKKYKRYFFIGLAALILPSGYILYKTVTQSVTTSEINQFIEENNVYPGTEVVSKEVSFDEGYPKVKLVLIGTRVPDPVLEEWERKLISVVPDVQLELVQNDGSEDTENLQRMIDLYEEGQSTVARREAELSALQLELSQTSLEREELQNQISQLNLPETLPAEMLALAPNVVKVGVAKQRVMNRDGDESLIPWVELTTAYPLDSISTVSLRLQMEDFLQARLPDAQSLRVRVVND